MALCAVIETTDTPHVPSGALTQLRARGRERPPARPTSPHAPQLAPREPPPLACDGAPRAPRRTSGTGHTDGAGRERTHDARGEATRKIIP